MGQIGFRLKFTSGSLSSDDFAVLDEFPSSNMNLPFYSIYILLLFDTICDNDVTIQRYIVQLIDMCCVRLQYAWFGKILLFTGRISKVTAPRK